MDIAMPQTSGIDATRVLHDQAPHIGVVVMTMLEDDDAVAQALRAGARGYIGQGRASGGDRRDDPRRPRGTRGDRRRDGEATERRIHCRCAHRSVSRADAQGALRARSACRRRDNVPDRGSTRALPEDDCATTSPASSPSSASPTGRKPSSRPGHTGSAAAGRRAELAVRAGWSAGAARPTPYSRDDAVAAGESVLVARAQLRQPDVRITQRYATRTTRSTVRRRLVSSRSERGAAGGGGAVRGGGRAHGMFRESTN